MLILKYRVTIQLSNAYFYKVSESWNQRPVQAQVGMDLKIIMSNFLFFWEKGALR